MVVVRLDTLRMLLNRRLLFCTQLQYSASSALGLLKSYQECYWGGCVQRLIRSLAALDLLYCYTVVFRHIPLLCCR